MVLLNALMITKCKNSIQSGLFKSSPLETWKYKSLAAHAWSVANHGNLDRGNKLKITITNLQWSRFIDKTCQ